MKYLLSGLFANLMNNSRHIKYGKSNISSLWYRYKKPLIGCIGCLSIFVVLILVGIVLFGIRLFNHLGTTAPVITSSGENSALQIQSGAVSVGASYLDYLVSLVQQRLPLLIAQ